MRYEIAYTELTNYLCSLTHVDFQDKKYSPDGVLKEFEFSEESLYKPFLVDTLGNDISVCVYTKRKYRLPTGRVISAKLECTLLNDCRKVYGTPLNGCWAIPDKFLTLK